MSLKPRLAGILAMIVGQGFVGWWMVRSGLEQMPENNRQPGVSPYRLSAHLISAFAIYCALFTTGMRVWAGNMANSMPQSIRSVRNLATATCSLVAFTVASGAFVAGNHAGLVYNEFPLMGGRIVPEDIVDPYLEPKWRNMFENSSLVQFNHRVLGISTASVVTYLWLKARQAPLSQTSRLAANCCLGMAGLQVSVFLYSSTF